MDTKLESSFWDRKIEIKINKKIKNRNKRN